MIRFSCVPLVLLCVLFATSSVADTPYMEPPGLFSGVETMFLRSGVDGYPADGNVLRGVGIRHVIGTGVVSDTTTTFGAPGQGYPRFFPRVEGAAIEDYRLLWKPDLSDLPDSAVIVRARLFLRVEATNNAWNSLGPSCKFAGYRLLRDWGVNEVNWMGRFAHADSGWHAYGGTDSTGTYACDECPTQETFNVGAQLTRQAASTTSKTTMGPYWANVYLDIQADNIYSGYGTYGLIGADYVDEEVFTTSYRVHSTAGQAGSERAWLPFDVTRPVAMWHYGVWANYGLVIRGFLADPTAITYFHADTDAEEGYRPLLVIEYLYAQDAPAGGFAAGNRRRGLQRQWIGWSPEALD